MVYKDLPGLIKRITEVKELKFQSLVVVIGYFFSLLHVALFSGKFWLFIVAITNFIWGISVLIHKKALFNVSENGPTEEIDGIRAIKFGYFLLFLGFILVLFYLF